MQSHARETLMAFHVFNQMRVKYGIVEVGMGGATDATNIMMHKAVTVISKIDLDHQEYLGRTIQAIARVKAGIMRPNVPCIVDHTNSDSVLDVLREYADSIGTEVVLSHQARPLLPAGAWRRHILPNHARPVHEEGELLHLWC